MDLGGVCVFVLVRVGRQWASEGLTSGYSFWGGGGWASQLVEDAPASP